MHPFSLLVHDSDDVVSQRAVQLLSDWSASGWLEGFALVSVSELLDRGEALAQNRVVLPATPDGPAQVRQLSRVVEGRPIRVVILDPVGWDPSWLAARALRHRAGKLLFDRITGRIAAIDAVISWHGGHWDPRMPAWPGWDTLIAAPQESVAPAHGGFDLYCDPTDEAQVLAVAAHAAAFTATVAALWAGVAASPWDNTDGLDDVRLARAFHVRLDGGSVLELLREVALSATALHAPGSVQGTSTAPFSARVEALRAKLVLEPLPVPTVRPGRQEVGAWAAIRMLVAFLWRSLVMAPSELSKVLLHKGKSTAATKLTGAIFGQDSTRQVTVAGVPGRRSDDAVRWATGSEQDVKEILHKLTRLDLQMAPTASPSGQEAFWRTTVDTVIALVSGERQHGVDPVVDEAVPRWHTVAELAPSKVQSWRVAGLNLSTAASEVPVNDLLRCDDALAELREMALSDAPGRDEIERNRRALERAADTWRQSFVGLVGAMLVDEINRYRQRIRDRMDELQRLTHPPTTEAEDLAGDLVRFSRAATLVALGIGALIGLLVWLNLVQWPIWVWLPLLIIFWLSALVGKYLSVQRRVFKLMHRAEEEESLVRVVEREIPVLAENLHRLLRVYTQYLSWSQLVPLFLAEPFGRATASTPELTRMSGFLPPSVISGRYEPRDHDHALNEVYSLTTAIRTPASQAWADFVTESYRLFSRRAEFAAQVPEDVYSLEDSRLRLWLELVSENGHEGLQTVQALAERLMTTHTNSLVERAGTQRMHEVVDSSFQIVTSEGKALDSSVLGQAAPADFSFAAFSINGLARELPKPDKSLPPTQGWREDSDDQSVRAVRSVRGHLLDEVRSLVIVTRGVQMSDLALRAGSQAETPAHVQSLQSPRVWF